MYVLSEKLKPVWLLKVLEKPRDVLVFQAEQGLYRRFQNSLPFSPAKVCLFFLFNSLLIVFSLSPTSSFGPKLLSSAPVEPLLCLKNKQIHCFFIPAQRRRSLYALSLSEALAGIHGRLLRFLTTVWYDCQIKHFYFGHNNQLLKTNHKKRPADGCKKTV